MNPLPVEGNPGFGEEAHGTAVAEIILDVAPQAELHLYTVGSEVEFLDAMDFIIKTRYNSRLDCNVSRMAQLHLRWDKPNDIKSRRSY